jgi:hypothetical protein
VDAAIIGGLVGAIVATLATWLFRRVTAIESFFTEAVGATWALAKAEAKPGEKSEAADAEQLAGVVLPLADALGLRVRSLSRIAREWADALNEKELPRARAAQDEFKRKSRLAGFWP